MVTEHATMTRPASPRETTRHRGHRPSGVCFSLGGVLTLYILTASLIDPRPARASISIDDLANYHADQGGHTDSGNITTDGVFGPLALSDIQSWTVTIDSTTFSSSDPGAAIQLHNGGLVLPTTSQTITIASPQGTMIDFSLFTQPAGSGRDAILCTRSTSGVSVADDYMGELFGRVVCHVHGPTLGDPNACIIADRPTAVPEPSTAVVAVFGAVTIVGYGVSRRRAQRRQGSA